MNNLIKHGKRIYISSTQYKNIETFCPLRTYFATWAIFWSEGIETFLDCLIFLVKIFK